MKGKIDCKKYEAESDAALGTIKTEIYERLNALYRGKNASIGDIQKTIMDYFSEKERGEESIIRSISEEILNSWFIKAEMVDNVLNITLCRERDLLELNHIKHQ